MRKIIYILLMLSIFMVGVALADVTCNEAIDRIVPSTVSGSFQITYQTSGASGQWGASIIDSVTGGCTFPSGSNSYQTVMLSEDGLSKTITINAPASGTCTFTGDYKFGECSIIVMGSDTTTIGGTGCTSGDTRACNVGSCAGTETCSSGSWGTCVKTDSQCGVGCTSGNTRACVATNSCAGTETCTSGVWGTCTTNLIDCPNNAGCLTTCPPIGCTGSGAGNCPTEPCQTATCSGGTCSYDPVADGTACVGGTCNGLGTCVPITTSGDCEFWETEDDDGSCKFNIWMIVLGFGMLFALKFAGGK